MLDKSVLFKRTKQHVAPIIELKADAIWRGATLHSVVDQGTMTFVRWQQWTYALTNEHVIRAYRGRESSVLSVALQAWQHIPARLLYAGGASCTRWPYDLAVFEWLDDSVLQRASKCPIALPEEPNLPESDELVLCVGYPGALRREVTPAQAAHGLYHIVVTVRFSDLANLQLRDAIEGLDSAVRFGSVSGGAVLRITADGNYSLAGIVYEGLGPADLTGSVYSADMIVAAAVPIWGKRLEALIASGCL